MVHAAGVIAAYGRSSEEMVRRHDEQCPMERMGDAWDVAYAALFLASARPDTSPAPNWSSMAGSPSIASETFGCARLPTVAV
jgi:NAD(P)-dependent dehydrogenase (short-subunit alcohol dehydrogenase family)